MNGEKSVVDVMNNLIERSRAMGVKSTETFELEEGITVLIAAFPKGVKQSVEVLDDLFEWAEEKGLQEVVEKIIELEELK